MAAVRVLPEALANQIAAGEVVERPVSVVKELVENALDAGATRVSVDVEDGGRTLVRVVDDGEGMGPEDARLAVLRHATSKIRRFEDLAAIGSLGFRGEALPSIASVSRFALVTRPHDAAAAVEVRIEGGGRPVVKDAGGAPGTRVEVRDLFYNVPARLKFLKRTATEMAHVKAFLTEVSLGYPHVHFRLSSNGRALLDHPAAPSLKQRIFQVLGRAVTDRLYEIRLDGPLRVLGFVSDPEHHRTNQGGIHTFVNGRAVKDRVVTHAVVRSYGELLGPGRFPVAVVYVHLDAGGVDVNVHPQKAEVRFTDAGAVHEALVRACRTTLSASPWSSLGLASRPAAERPAPARPLPLDGFGLREGPGDAATEDRPDGGASRVSEAPRVPWNAVRQAPELPRPSRSQALSFEPAAGENGARLLGATTRGHAVWESPAGLHVLSASALARAVCERELRAGLASGGVPSQPLLFPIQVELSARDAGRLAAGAETVRAFGFEVEPFGGPTWEVGAIPRPLAGRDGEALLRALLRGLASGDPAPSLADLAPVPEVRDLADLVHRAPPSLGLAVPFEAPFEPAVATRAS